MEKIYYTVSETANILGISARTIYNSIQRRAVRKFIKPNWLPRIEKSGVNNALKTVGSFVAIRADGEGRTPVCLASELQTPGCSLRIPC